MPPADMVEQAQIAMVNHTGTTIGTALATVIHTGKTMGTVVAAAAAAAMEVAAATQTVTTDVGFTRMFPYSRPFRVHTAVVLILNGSITIVKR